MKRPALPTRGENPLVSNYRRHHEKMCAQVARKAFVITSSRGPIPRRRKKYVYKQERANYATLLGFAVVTIMRRELH